MSGSENEIREYVYKGGGYFWARTSKLPGVCEKCITKETSIMIQEHPKEPWKYACEACMPSQQVVPMQAIIRSGKVDYGAKLARKRQRALFGFI